MTMEVLIRSHEVFEELPWPPRGRAGRYSEFREALQEDVGKWHVFTVADGVSMENTRGAILSFAKTEGWRVTTSKNGRRLGVKRTR